MDHELSGPVSPSPAYLAEPVYDAELVRSFIVDYLRLLDERVSSITDHLEHRHYDAAIVVLLSLQTSSAMIGAERLARATLELRRCIETRLAHHDISRGDLSHNEADQDDHYLIMVMLGGMVAAVEPTRLQLTAQLAS